MKRILVAGATGYLGSFVTKEFANQDYYTTVIIRNLVKFEALKIQVNETIVAEVTKKATLRDCCRNIDVVFSSVGITRQKDGFTYMDVDYRANLNLLNEAKKSGVKKFIYVSVLKGDQLRNLKICEAKEKFVDALKNSGMEYCIIRPTGYFSDMEDFYKMAKKGRVYLLGNGKHKMNPIHGEDLAKVCVDTVENKKKEILIGGPEVLTYNQIAETAFAVCGKRKKITHLPAFIGKFGLAILKTFMNSTFYGPIEFLISVLSIDMIAPKYGNRTLKMHFQELGDKGSTN